MSAKSDKFKDDIDKLMAAAMPGIAPMFSRNVADADLVAAAIERFASHLGMIIAFAHQGDSKKIEEMIEGVEQYIYEGVAHFKEVKRKVAKLKPINLNGEPF